jgi:hypothetical protein
MALNLPADGGSLRICVSTMSHKTELTRISHQEIWLWVNFTAWESLRSERSIYTL